MGKIIRWAVAILLFIFVGLSYYQDHVIQQQRHEIQALFAHCME